MRRSITFNLNQQIFEKKYDPLSSITQWPGSSSSLFCLSNYIWLYLVSAATSSYCKKQYKVLANYIWLYLASAIHRYFSHCKKILANSNFFFILQETYTYTTQLLLHISRHFSIRTDREISKFDVISIHLPDVGAKPCL